MSNIRELDEYDEDLIEITFLFAYENINRDLCGQIQFCYWKQYFVEWAEEFEKKYINTDWNELDYSDTIEKFTLEKINKVLAKEYCLD